MTTKEQIKQHLENQGYVEVAGTWTFYGRSMQCYNEGCCGDSYNSIDEAVEMVVSYAKADLSDVDLI